MIIQRKCNSLKDVEKSADYKILKILMQDEHNKLITDRMGNICFVGNTEKCRKVIWKNLLTGQDSDEISANVKYVYNGGQPQFRGYLVCDVPLGEDEVIIYDVAKFKNINGDLNALFMFMITNDSLLNDIKNSYDYNDNEMHDSQDNYNKFSRVRISMRDSHAWLNIEKFAKGLIAEKQNYWKVTDGNCYASYCNKNRSIIVNGRVIKSYGGSVDRLMAICSAQKPADNMISVKNCAYILSSSGYMYIEPFAYSEVNTEDLIVEIVANRQLPLEIYDEKRKIWTAFEQGTLKKCGDMRNIKLRICVESGDYIRNIAIKNI